MDTSVMEYTAEDLISHHLQRAGVLVAKPKFDQLGTDLIAMVAVTDGARFCRIQCKGRSLVNSPTARVEIPREYASDAFVAFLYVDVGSPTTTHLFCFTGSDIRKWKSQKEKYCLTIRKKTFASNLCDFLFTEQKAADVKELIVRVGIVGHFNPASTGYVKSSLEDVTASFIGVSQSDGMPR